MPVRVRGSDGIIIEFPDNTDPQTINSVMAQRHTEYEARSRAGNQQMGAQPQPQRPAGPQRSPQYQAEMQRRQSIRAPYTDERWRREGVPEALVPLARGVESFNRNGPAAAMGQMWRNMGVQDDLAYWQNRIRGRDTAQAAYDDTQQEQARVAREQPGVNTAANVASIPAFGGNPVAAAPMSMLRAGAGAMAVNAPFALARQEGNLAERLPGAAREEAAVGAFGAGFQGLANRFLANPAANSAAQRAATFDRAGVRPTMAGVTAPEPPANVPVSADPGRTAVVTRAIAENPVVGAIPMRHMRRSLGDTAARAEQVARAYGPRTGPEATGEQVQSGLRRFAFGDGAGSARPTGSMRNWSFDQRANQLYQRWWNGFRAAEGKWRQRGQNAPQAVTDETRIVFDDIFGRNTPEVADELNDNVLGRLRNLLTQRGPGENAGAGRTFQDLRDIRTYVRQLQRSDPSMRPTLPDANLERLEQALTSDMYATAMFTGGQDLARQLHQIDRYYRVGSERIQSSLRAFLREGESPAQAYGRIIAAASQGGRQNTRLLTSVRRSLQPHEWRQVAATAIDELGRAGKGHPFAAEGAFSVEQFSTRWNAMSPEGRRALFGHLGSPEGNPAGGSFVDLERALDDLARVAGMQKAVERAANTSNSAVAGQAVGTAGGLIVSPQTVIPILVGLGALGEALTNPMFVRWMVSAARAGGGSGGIRQQLGSLAAIAARDPALAPLYTELTQRVTGSSPAQEAQQPERIGQLQ